MNSNERALDLLHQARQTLTQDVMPSISLKDRYNCLMVANALSIIARHFQGACGASTTANPSPICEEAVVRGIRAGHFDGGMPMRAGLVSILRDQLTHQLAIDNPRLLDQLTQSSDRAHRHGLLY
ncbi:hypothetical protein K2O51_33735 (plasmid) [Cupriavidus pinatubonensis]|uniref:DUF6285 domain-containing protein n=1 Tax=Cupriavidus pinatubonensis TaxID=248026 RepID=UPI001C7344E2|nr:DUF6285 domain-containing protein [Cupriavidus pinatubonensis]QYY33805.1 hypothetical protein K2O51_33735 [Cupriavidus pinatubonensis]